MGLRLNCLSPICFYRMMGKKSNKYGGYSSVGLEHWIVVPEVAGSNPVIHPNLLYNYEKDKKIRRKSAD